MPLKSLKCVGTAISAIAMLVTPVVAQNPIVRLQKRATIPKVCESVVPASIDHQVDVEALVKEAKCKGAGDMLSEYTFVMHETRRGKDKKKPSKEEVTTYEVYVPTLKAGISAKGVMLVSSRNGVPVPPDELARERRRAGERLEREESNIARQHSPSETTSGLATGMRPIGVYLEMRINGNVFILQDLLDLCELKLTKRQQIEGRETLVFGFAARPSEHFNDDEKYFAPLSGTIWIDAHDRIVTRLVAWPSRVTDAIVNKADPIVSKAAAPSSTKRHAIYVDRIDIKPARSPGEQPTAVYVDRIDTNPPIEKPPAVYVNQIGSKAAPTPSEKPPAVYVEMMRLPEGIWLPKVARLNGADYPKLFNSLNYDAIYTIGKYKRFSTEIQDVQLDAPKTPR